jgi:hypothetical protein
MKITVRQYYEGFVSLFGLVASVPFVAPLLHLFFPDSSAVADYLYPPLGDVEWIAVAATVGFLAATTFVVFSCCQSAKRIHKSVPAILLSGLALGVCALIILHVLFVRHIPVPSVNLDVPVSVGYQRSDLAAAAYPPDKGWNDWKMLGNAGPREEQIQNLWTHHSIWVVRVSLWLSYTLSLACFLAVMSLAAYQHSAEEAAKKSPHCSEMRKERASEDEAQGSCAGVETPASLRLVRHE